MRKKSLLLGPNTNKRARLDFLISESLIYMYSDVEDVTMLPGYRTDHSMAFSPLDLINLLEDVHTGNNNSLLSIRKTSPCNEYPLKPHFYIEKLGFAGVYLFFLFLL